MDTEKPGLQFPLFSSESTLFSRVKEQIGCLHQKHPKMHSCNTKSKSKTKALSKKHSVYAKKSHSHYYASSPTLSGNIHMPSIIARQDALVFVDKSRIAPSLNGSGEEALFWSPGILVGEDATVVFSLTSI